MIISVENVKQYIKTDVPDAVLEDKLQALELLVRNHTNNRFQKIAFRVMADIIGGTFIADSNVPFLVGDTIQVSDPSKNAGLYTVKEVSENTFTVNEPIVGELVVLCTKVEYPADIKVGVINMLKWDLENRDKVGIQSETISRHSVTYFNMDANNSSLGYPTSLVGFLKPYMKARF